MTTDLPLEEPEHIGMVRDAARRFLQTEWPSDQAVQLAIDPDALQLLWSKAAREGWTALSADGEELGLDAAIAIQQELGRAACPLPLMDAVFANSALAGAQGRAANLLEELEAGRAIVTWVFKEASPIEARDGALSGHAAFVENAVVATHFLVETGSPGEIAIVKRDACGVRITPSPGLAVPPLAEVVFADAPAELVHTSWNLAMLQPLARLLLSARAHGSAQYGLELLTDYAKIRRQFGKPIGQYQAIQHKLANCLIAVEVCRLALVRAGRAGPGVRDYCAAVAAALAFRLLRKVVLDEQRGFGGIAFWHEHEMPRHFHRIHGDLTRLGGLHAARRHLANIVMEQGALPEFSYGHAADAFRREVRDWLSGNWDGTLPPETSDMPLNERKAIPSFSRKLAEKGWLTASWPKEYGGQGRSALEHLAFEEEMWSSDAPNAWHNSAANMIGPALLRHGSEAQKQILVPKIAAGEISFALGYSEPEHGSDLAGVRTAATRTLDGGWSISGQKIFTSAMAWATHVFLLARTDAENRGHGGLSIFVVPTDLPGITTHPMLGLNGHSAATVFFDEVKVDAEALVGETNAGWKVVTDALAFERVAMGAIAAQLRGSFEKLVRSLRARSSGNGSRLPDTLLLDQIGMLAADVEGARLFGVQTAQMVEKGLVPSVEAAMLKVYSSELMERMSEAAFDLLGTGATLKKESSSAVGEGVFEYGIRHSLQYTIGGGTNEIQRTLIAVRGLRLPR